MFQLDLLDRKILWELDRNGRQSISDLSRALKQSRERIEYRIARLKERGILQAIIATINPQRIGFSIYKTYLRVENNRDMIEKLLQHLRNHERLSWLAVCDGSWDVAFCLYAQSAKEFHDLHVNLLSQFNSVVLNFASYSLTDTFMFDRGYLWKGQKRFRQLGGQPGALSVDALDISILNLLHKNGRATFAELSNLLKVTASTVQHRIEQLEKQQVITGYRASIDLAKIGMLSMKTIFFLRDYGVSLRKEFRAFCDEHPNITCYTEQIGDCNLEIEMEVSSTEAYSRILDEIRERYAKFIKNFHTMLLRETDHQWLPRSLIKANSL